MHFSQHQSAASQGPSARKIEANRANARKSTGPKSPSGKARSSRNATRHGLLAETATLLAQSNREIESLLAEYRAGFRPNGVHEDTLVSELAVAAWRIKQANRIETGVFWVEMQEGLNSILNADRPIRLATAPVACAITGMPPEPDESEEPEPEIPSLADTSEEMRTLLMGVAWVNNPKAFALVVRYQSQARRDYFRALKELEAVRTGKAGYLPEDEPPSQIGKPLVQESRPAASETNPTAAPAKAAAAAASTSGTKPNVPDFTLQWDVAPFEVHNPDWRKMYERNDKKNDKKDDEYLKFT